VLLLTIPALRDRCIDFPHLIKSIHNLIALLEQRIPTIPHATVSLSQMPDLPDWRGIGRLRFVVPFPLLSNRRTDMRGVKDKIATSSWVAGSNGVFSRVEGRIGQRQRGKGRRGGRRARIRCTGGIRAPVAIDGRVRCGVQIITRDGLGQREIGRERMRTGGSVNRLEEEKGRGESLGKT
jgi:hypothetical protein